MGTSRRGFLKNMLKGAAVLGLAPVIKHLPEIPVEEKFTETTKETGCQFFTPNITIEDYSPGDTVEYQDLSYSSTDCNGCVYDFNCPLTKDNPIKYDDGCELPGEEKELYLTDGHFIPEAWSKKLQARFYEQTAFNNWGRKIGKKSGRVVINKIPKLNKLI